MLKALLKFLKYAGFAVIVLVAMGALLFMFGLRVVLDGGGSPHLRFVKSADAQAEELARHREAQRAQPPPPAPVAPEPPAPTSEGTPADVTKPSLPSPIAPASTPRGSTYWTDFRGPLRDGHYRQQAIRTDWPADGLKPLWKEPIGGGYASIVIANGRAFTIEQRGAQEVVAAYDVASGRELWTNGWNAAFREMMGGDGPRATPTWAEGRVYALGAQGEFRAIEDGTGRAVWRTNILEDAGARNLQWGMSASPLVVNNTVVVLPGGPNGQSVVAYDRASGTRAWSAQGDQQAYSSPMLVTLAGVRQIVVFSAARLMGLSSDGGKVLWEYPWKTQFDINASQPLVVGDNRLFLSSGYGTGAAVIELTRTGDALSVREVWRNIRMKNQFSSSVLQDGYIYGLDEAILACVDAATGDLKWKGGRYGYGQVILASGHLVVLTEDGNLALVRATPERHEERVRFPVLEGKTWNVPAMSDGFLLVRNLAEMAAFDLRPR
ncbi:MAG: PQQ-binding-like beta-propeller repeat protein [Vicinamibacterales bacterium]